MKPRLLNVILLFVAISALLISGCTSAPALRVGIATHYPPITFMNNGVLEGVEPALAKEVSVRTGRPVSFEIMAFEQLITALQENKIDLIMSGMSDTPERRKLVSFADSYLHIGQMLLVRDQDIRRFPTALHDKNSGVRIGVKQGTTGEAFVLKTFTWGSITHFASTEEGVAALEQRTIDCFVHDAPTIWRFSANAATRRQGLSGLYEPLTDEPLAWAVRKTDTDLLVRLNAVLAEMRKDGTLHKILVKWVPTQILGGNRK